MGQGTHNSFRDHIATTDDEGRRSWIYASRPKGKLHTYRAIIATVLLAGFFITPFIELKGEPLILINIFERKFILFGKVFWPQDLHLFAIATISIVITIILFTVVYGRIWCGWACPQTLFLEMVYRKIEFWIEGDAFRQRKLDSEPLSLEKVWKKTLKHIIYLVIAVVVIHIAVSYIIGIERVLELAEEGPDQHFASFTAIAFLTLLYYFIFARFREQVCILVCPYGRLQGVMLDSNSLVVAYDYIRGEKRSKYKKSVNRNELDQGDCIDCGNCVRVCPTGIDIRNGTQLECINCTACIDACNRVMHRIGFKPGLIRVASSVGISQGSKFRFTTRIIAYSALLAVLISLLVILFVMRADTETTILRIPGTLFQVSGDEISNIYKVSIINKSTRVIPIEIRLINQQGRLQFIGKSLTVNEQETGEGVFLVYLKKHSIGSSAIPVIFGIYSQGELLEKAKATFVAP
jgi:cytochrome c oxidase accessory protein FixG